MTATLFPMTHRRSRTISAPNPPRFQTDVEGLRAVAVFVVVAFHASVPGFTGGFVGVDVFFVISGYLITRLLIREALSTGRISFQGFYARRARRILPAASVVLVVTAIASWLILPTLAAYRTASDLVSAALYFANWHFIGLGTNYLAQSTEHSVVLHFWSLAVEEQFYIVWPLLVLFAVTLSRRFPMAGTRVLCIVLGSVTAISFVASYVLTTSDPGLAYMATTTRAWQFGAGGLLAIISHWLLAQRTDRPKLARAGWFIGWAGLAAIIIGVVGFDESTPFPGTAALLPTVGAVAVIAGGLLWGTTGGAAGGLLSLAPVRFVGKVSFSWYLWHWPVLILTEAITGPLSWQVRSLLMVGAFGLAVLTYYGVEKAAANWPTVKKRISSALALGVLCMVVSTTVALGTGSAAVAKLVGTEGGTVTAASYASVFGSDSGANSGPVVPSALAAAKDIPQPDVCLLDHSIAQPKQCVVGDPNGADVVLFGDSHAHQWVPALTKIAIERHWRMTIMAKSGCPVPAIAPRADGSRMSEPECAQWRQQSINTILGSMKPTLVIVSSLSTYIPDSGETLTAWNATLDQLRKVGAPIVYIRDTPVPTQDIPTCISGALDDWSKCAFNLKDKPRIEPVVLEAVKGTEDAVHVVDLTGFFCDTSGECPAVRNGTLLYRDDSHITATAASLLAPAMDAALVDAGVVKKATK